MTKILFVHAAEGRLGSFAGHTPPALLMIGFSVLMFGMSFKRARALQATNHASHKSVGTLFAERYIVEPNMTFMRVSGTMIAVLTSLGIFFEYKVMSIDENYHGLGHQVFYFSFALFGVSAVLESFGRIPRDTARAVLAVVLLLEFVMLHPHAMMKEDVVDKTLHIYESYLGLANAMILTYSVIHKRSLLAYLGSFGVLCLQGIWWITIGFWMGGADYVPHMIATYLGLEALLMILLVLCISATFLPPSPTTNNHNNSPLDEKNYDTDIEHASEQFIPLAGFE